MDNSVLNALKSSGVNQEDIDYLQKKFKTKFFNVEDCDRELIKLGYEPIFVLDLDDDYEDDYEEDDDYEDYQKISSRKHFDD